MVDAGVMPGVIINDMAGAVITDPQRFNPRDIQQWEWITGDEAPDEDTFSIENGVATMSGYLKQHVLLHHALAYFVGYSRVAGSTIKLFRWLPAVHPRWPMLRCVSVSVKGVEFDREINPLPPHQPFNYLRLPVYHRYRFDCHFEQPEVNYRENDQVESEWDRMIEVATTDENEMIVVSGGQYQYRAPALPWDLKPPELNGPFLKVYSQRSGVTVVAHQIPADWIHNTSGIPVHFLQARGKVNSTTFLGLAPGTMMLQRYEIVKRAQPIATNSVNSLLFGCRVTMHFGFTDPDRAYAGETLRGWQLVPAVQGVDGSGWYAILNTRTGAALYPTFDMHKLLQHWTT